MGNQNNQSKTNSPLKLNNGASSSKSKSTELSNGIKSPDLENDDVYDMDTDVDEIEAEQVSSFFVLVVILVLSNQIIV